MVGESAGAVSAGHGGGKDQIHKQLMKAVIPGQLGMERRCEKAALTSRHRGAVGKAGQDLHIRPHVGDDGARMNPAASAAYSSRSRS